MNDDDKFKNIAINILTLFTILFFLYVVARLVLWVLP